MNLAEKLKALRRQAGMSQEKLAEKLGVSRQAVTKWETDSGVPDIENLRAISGIFDVSIDELLSDSAGKAVHTGGLYESVTEYDLDEKKRFDMKLGGARRLILWGYEGEKLKIRLVSDTLQNLQSDFKVKIDDIRKRIDLDLSRRNGVSETVAKKELDIYVQLPEEYISKAELAVNAEEIEIRSLECESLELDIKSRRLILDGVSGTVEINCNLDMEIDCLSLDGAVEINQVSATSRIFIPDGAPFTAVTRGIGTKILYEKNGEQAEPFCVPDADNVIELNGIRSELVICAGKKEGL